MVHRTVAGVGGVVRETLGPRPNEVAVELEGISKVYPGQRAVDGVNLVVRKGEIHSIVGVNGAGKSTLIKILSGAHPPTAGRLRIAGLERGLRNPRDAKRFGVAVVYQELTVIHTLTTIANVFLGQETRKGVFFDNQAMLKRYSELCRALSVTIPPNALGAALSLADRQAIEILRALVGNAGIVIMDEPTAALSLRERESLYRTLRSLSMQDVAVVFVSHDLEEVLNVSDTITVLRAGRVVASRPAREWSKGALAGAMLGVTLSNTSDRGVGVVGREILHAKRVRQPGSLHDIEFRVHAGEIVGIAGLVGSGRTELLRALAGLEPSAHGELAIAGRVVPWPRNPRDALRHGLVLAPEDRQTDGLALGMLAHENINLTRLSAVAVGPIMLKARELRRARVLGELVGLDPRLLSRRCKELSGGNQQKVLLAKWMDTGARILLVDEPTRGIDIGAKLDVLRVLRAMAESGVGVVMVSSDLHEVLEYTDRIVVLSAGRVLGEHKRGQVSFAELMSTLLRVEE